MMITVEEEGPVPGAGVPLMVAVPFPRSVNVRPSGRNGPPLGVHWLVLKSHDCPRSRRIAGGGAPVAAIVTVFWSPSLNTSGGLLEKTGAVPALRVKVWRSSPAAFFARSISVY